jgi:tetratricopeptide (TPR) repeat protein
MRYLRYILVFALMVLGLAKVGAQNDRNFIRQGNRAYHKQKWAAAETQYRKAISKNQKNAQAVYNLGCALMMQQKDSMAMIQFENASKLETNKMRRARSYHNMGVVMQQHQQYAQAIGCYENALRCNPQDKQQAENKANAVLTDPTVGATMLGLKTQFDTELEQAIGEYEDGISKRTFFEVTGKLFILGHSEKGKYLQDNTS